MDSGTSSCSGQENGAKPNRQAKDSVFCDLFSDPRYLLELYKSLHPEDNEATEADVKTVTMHNVLMKDIYNDLGFLARGKLLVLVEAQSTYSENAAVRVLLYFAQTLRAYIASTRQNPYGHKKLNLPETELYVVYTGERESHPDKISLARSFGISRAQEIECVVHMVYGDTDDESILNQYIAFAKIFDAQAKLYGRTKKAVEQTIKMCKSKNILKEYLESRETEVISIMDLLFNQEYLKEIREEELREEVRKESLAEGERNKAIETAKNFIKMGLLSIEQIAMGTGLPVEEVNRLSASI